MSTQVPGMREVLNNGVVQQLADVLREIVGGDLIAALVRKLGEGRAQAFQYTATGTPQALTFAALGLEPPEDTGYSVIVQGETVARVTVDESTKALDGFSVLGAANGEVVQGVVLERNNEPVERPTVTASVATLSRIPKVVLDVVATAGTSLGRKTLKIGSMTPAAGEVVWDRGKKLTFASGDAVTGCKVVSLSTTSTTASFLERVLGQQD